MKKYKFTTYLVGAIESVSSSDCTFWRDKITPELLKLNVKVIDPTKNEAEKTGYDLEESKEKLHQYKRKGQWELFDTVMDVIINTDLIAVNSSDFIIAYIGGRMGGTVAELSEAYRKQIPIFAFTYDPISEVNSWILRMIRSKGDIFPNLHQLIVYIQNNIANIKRKKIKNFNGYSDSLGIAQEKLKLLLPKKAEEIKKGE